MRGFGLKCSAVVLICIFLLFSAGCDEEKKTVCCQCTCYVLDGALQDTYPTVQGTNINCDSKCRTRCAESQRESKDPATVECQDTLTE